MIKISVVIPCRNEEAFIAECIEAVFACDLPENTEVSVFVIDGMSDDQTRVIVKQLQESYLQLHLIDNPDKTTPYAFNLGVKAQQCDYIQRVDARHIISKNYLVNCLNKLQSDSSIWCVGGKIENVYINEKGRVISKAMGTALGMGLGNFRTLNESGFTDTVTSPMYPYWVFEKIGYFDEELIRNQDDDFNFRVAKAGGKIFFDASISLKYYVRGNFKNLWKQFNQYGYWKVYVNCKHNTVTTIRQLVPPAFVVYLFLVLISWLLGTVTGGISSLPLLLYILLVLYTSYKIKKEDPVISFKEIVLTFPILHISYGLGYLKGMTHFMLFKRKPAEHQKKMTR